MFYAKLARDFCAGQFCIKAALRRLMMTDNRLLVAYPVASTNSCHRSSILESVTVSMMY